MKAADPSGHLVGISCTQGTHCVAIDTSGDVVTSTDPLSATSTWQVTKVDATGRPVAISCPSTTLCVMIDKTGTIFSSTDPTGGATAWHSTSLGSVSGLVALSCPTTSFCALTATTGSTYATANPTGVATTWHITDQATTITALSCVTASLCVGGAKHTTYTSRDTTTEQFTWDTQTTTPELLSDGTDNFLYGPGGQVIEQEGMTTTGQPLYLVHDALGSTTVVTNLTRVESTYSYSPYGTVTKHTGPDTTPIGFAGTYTDLGTGLLYLVHRYYTPSTGQFLSVDPKVATTHQPYEYASDDPIMNSDPMGMMTICETMYQTQPGCQIDRSTANALNSMGISTVEIEKLAEFQSVSVNSGLCSGGKCWVYTPLLLFMGTSNRYPNQTAAEFIIYSNLYKGRTVCNVGSVTTKCNSESKWLEAWGSLGSPDGYDESLEAYDNMGLWKVGDWAEHVLQEVYTGMAHPDAADEGLYTGSCSYYVV